MLSQIGVSIEQSQPGAWLLSVMRTPSALPPSSHGKERAVIIKRRRFKQTKSLKDRLLQQAQSLRNEAKNLPFGKIRERTLRRARQAIVAAHLDDWLRSPGLRPPKKPDNPSPH